MRKGILAGVLIAGLAFSACERQLDTYQPLGSYPSRVSNSPVVFENGNFESWFSETMPVRWIVGTYSTSYDEFDFTAPIFEKVARSTNAYEGACSILLQWGKQQYDSPVLIQSFTPEPGSNYVFTIQTKIASGAPKIALAFKWFRDDMSSAGYSSMSTTSARSTWSNFTYTVQCPWSATLGYVMVVCNTSASFSGAVYLDGAILSNYGGGEPPEPIDPATFTGPYAAVTNVNYDSAFHGTYTIADLKAQADGTGLSIQIKGVITGVDKSGTTYSFWMQDATGGIYVYGIGDDFGIDEYDFGKIVTFTVNTITTYSGLREVTAGTGSSVTDPAPTNNEPTAIYVKDITTTDNVNQGMVVRYTADVSAISSSTVSFSSYPSIYFYSGNPYLADFTVGDTVTVIAPQAVFNTTVQIAARYAVFPSSTQTFWGIHAD